MTKPSTSKVYVNDINEKDVLDEIQNGLEFIQFKDIVDNNAKRSRLSRRNFGVKGISQRQGGAVGRKATGRFEQGYELTKTGVVSRHGQKDPYCSKQCKRLLGRSMLRYHCYKGRVTQ